MAKTKIHWSVFLFIGAFVSIVSFVSDRDELQLFIYAGFLLIAVGLIKFIVWLVGRRKKETTTRHGYTSQHAGHPHHAQHPHTPQQQHHGSPQHATHAAQPHQRAAHFCQHCGTQLQSTARFCSGCGQRRG